MGHWQGGSTRRWRKIRQQVFAAKGTLCTLRLEGCTGVATHIHHTRDRDIYGDDPEYLEPACAGCNIRTGDPVQHDPDPLPDW